jgi:hypothetical protein
MMLLPQVAEVDSYDTAGLQRDDINSVYEYIDQVLLGNLDATPEDEDDDSGRNFFLPKMLDLYRSKEVILTPDFKPRNVKNTYPSLREPNLRARFTEIIAPPPEA